jgi:heat-inducible transcriptional repressor
MRVLRPEEKEERKQKILNWLTHTYIMTGKPVSSKEIFDSKLFNISPASIRNIMKELDEEGYLEQVHTSGGRIPTDKAYRFYIDNILKLQKFAEEEKERIEIAYEKRINEIDYFLKHTTKILSDLTKKIGFSVISDLSSEIIKRFDIIRVSGHGYLLIIVFESGLIKHIPFTFYTNSKLNLRVINSDLNKKLKGMVLSEALNVILKDFVVKDEIGIYKTIYDVINTLLKSDEDVFLDGFSSIYDSLDDFSNDEIRSITRLLEEKEKFANIIREKFVEKLKNTKAIDYDGDKKKPSVDVLIGSECQMKELNNFSLVTSYYSFKDKNLGLIGVIGHKRMEYPRVITIVEAMSLLIEEILNEWDKEIGEL